MPGAKYPMEATHGSKQKMQGLHKRLTKVPENEKLNELNEENSLVRITIDRNLKENLGRSCKPVLDVHAEVPSEYDEVAHPPLCKY